MVCPWDTSLRAFSVFFRSTIQIIYVSFANFAIFRPLFNETGRISLRKLDSDLGLPLKYFSLQWKINWTTSKFRGFYKFSICLLQILRLFYLFFDTVSYVLKLWKISLKCLYYLNIFWRTLTVTLRYFIDNLQCFLVIQNKLYKRYVKIFQFLIFPFWERKLFLKNFCRIYFEESLRWPLILQIFAPLLPVHYRNVRKSTWVTLICPWDTSLTDLAFIWPFWSTNILVFAIAYIFTLLNKTTT